jgi:hypothetical protein
MGRRDTEKRRRGDAIRQAGRTRRSEAIRNAPQIQLIQAASAAENTLDKPTTGPEVATGANSAPTDQITSSPADRALPSGTAFLVQVRTAGGRERQGFVATYIVATETPAQAISAVRAATANSGGEVIDYTFPIGPQTVIGLALAKGQVILIKGRDSPSAATKGRGAEGTSATRNDG